jgi:predicted RNA-binding protein with PIN domain
MEELGEEIHNIRYLATVENLFTYEGEAGHEIIMIFDAEFQDSSIYEKEVVDVSEADVWYKAHWVSKDDLISGKVIVYPEGIKELL